MIIIFIETSGNCGLFSKLGFQITHSVPVCGARCACRHVCSRSWFEGVCAALRAFQGGTTDRTRTDQLQSEVTARNHYYSEGAPSRKWIWAHLPSYLNLQMPYELGLLNPF